MLLGAGERGKADRMEMAHHLSALSIFRLLSDYDDYLSRDTPDAPLGEFLAFDYEKWRKLPGLAPLFQNDLEQGRAVLSLDGLDEVLETAVRQYVADRTEVLIRQWAGKGREVENLTEPARNRP